MIKKTKENRVKKVKETEDIRKLYNIPAYAVNGIYVTSLAHSRSTTVRLTFTETNADLGEAFPVCAVNMPIENLQQWYDVVGQLLQKCRIDKRID